MVDQVNKPPTPPVEIEANLPETLNSAILKSLSKEPSLRFQSAEEFQLALLQVPYEVIPNPPHASNSRVWLAWAAALAVILILAVTTLRGKPLQWLSVRAGQLFRKPDVIAPRPILPTPQPPAVTANFQGPKSIAAESPKFPPVSAAHETTMRPRQTLQAGLPDSQAPVPDESPFVGPQPLASDVDPEAVVKPNHNRLAGGLGKIWHVVRHKKSTASDESCSPSCKQ
jgi:hypothetical protein